MAVSESGLKLVARIADRDGVKTLAREAGVPLTTVRSFRDRGWRLKSLPICEKLIAAAERLERDGAGA
jgi:hypothetical protein